MASADFCRPFRIPYEIRSPYRTDLQISPGKSNHLPSTSAAFTTLSLDGYGLYPVTWTRPDIAASYAVCIPRIGVLPPASFRPHLAMDALAIG